jgi:hypothetical protein
VSWWLGLRLEYIRTGSELRLPLVIDLYARLGVLYKSVTIMLLLLLQLYGARVVIKGDINMQDLHAELYLCDFR